MASPSLLPPDVPVAEVEETVRGIATSTPLAEDADGSMGAQVPHFNNLAEFTRWLVTQPPKGRSKQEIDEQIAEERASWD